MVCINVANVTKKYLIFSMLALWNEKPKKILSNHTESANSINYYSNTDSKYRFIFRRRFGKT